MISPVQPWRQSRSRRSIKMRKICWKVGFEPGVKEWRNDGRWEWWWWQGWADNWMRRWVETWLARLTEWIWELIPETRWCISEWAICDIQWEDGWWARKGDNRWGAGTARGLKRDQIVKIASFTGCKNFVGKRKKLMFSAFVVQISAELCHFVDLIELLIIKLLVTFKQSLKPGDVLTFNVVGFSITVAETGSGWSWFLTCLPVMHYVKVQVSQIKALFSSV